VTHRFRNTLWLYDHKPSEEYIWAKKEKEKEKKRKEKP
jgi:hypothetical protein